MIMKQTVEEAAKECRRTTAQSMGVYAQYHSIDECPNHGITYDEIAEAAFIKGAEWQSKQSPWINVEERLPEENENIIIMCEHGAIFNGSYCNGVWFCMDGYIYDTYKNSPIYSSMSSIPTLWKPIAYMPIPSFDEILEANKDVLQRLK